uniref:serpin family protein n=1 Tax=uncultured Draconibacterium sp. TaxID=1573823 RepID=UPI003217A77F
MRTLLSLFTVFLLAVIYSCSQNTDSPNTPKVIELDEKSAQLVEADNAFGLENFKKISQESTEDNIMVSPLSISLALAMAYNGAAGDTKSEMEEALKLNGLTPEQINNSYKMLVNALQSLDEDVVFEIANAIFHEENFPVKQVFLDLNNNYYNAEVDGIDFSSPAALTTINNWVANKTHDKITEILDALSSDARMVLLNAIYFYGTWTKEFNKEGTKLRNFNMVNGSTKEVPMMSKEDKLDYLSNNLFSAVKLPYGTGQYNMMVMLPAEGKNSQDIIEELSAKNWKNWTNDFESHENVVVTMPRFKFEFKAQLIKVLQQMGMQKAFSPSADFSGISDVALYISKVIHKTYIDVNETGTEAAAVTAIVFEVTSAGPSEPQKIYFTVDKPFVFAITEKDTNAILFIGEVKNPEY